MKNNIKFDFDDMLIVSKVNTRIYSRYKDIVLNKPLPLFTAPMDTVVNLNNMDIFLDKGIKVVLPRTVQYSDFKHHIRNKNQQEYAKVFLSFGIEDIEALYKTNFKMFIVGQHILIDVANGHMQKIVDLCREMRRLRPDVVIMVGNIGNPEAYTWYAKNDCVDFIRVGIGNGNGCLTTKQSGIGYPKASLIQETYQEKLKCMAAYQNRAIPEIVADGGMKDYSDIIKALALGADHVMVGSIFNKALESCADNHFLGFKISEKSAMKLFKYKLPVMKYFRGMSTKEAQKAMGKKIFKTSEGVVRYRRVEYTLSGWVENFEHYLRNAMSYTDSKTLSDFIGKVDVCQITKNAYDRFNK